MPVGIGLSRLVRGQRQRLGPALEAAGERDRGAELADRRPREDRPAARWRGKQGDPPGDGPGSGPSRRGSLDPRVEDRAGVRRDHLNGIDTKVAARSRPPS
jgi:hypothetical protein